MGGHTCLEVLVEAVLRGEKIRVVSAVNGSDITIESLLAWFATEAASVASCTTRQTVLDYVKALDLDLVP